MMPYTTNSSVEMNSYMIKNYMQTACLIREHFCYVQVRDWPEISGRLGISGRPEFTGRFQSWFSGRPEFSGQDYIRNVNVYI